MAKVLVVDDSMTQRQILSTMLEKMGLTVLIATDGVDALDKVQGSEPDMVMLDIVMPRMNGYEVCRKIKSDPRTQHIPVVICSSKSEEFDCYWGMKQGADAYLAKPFTPAELLNTIQKLMHSYQGIDRDKHLC
ncbi:response regulator [Synechococcales cyanobacterium C]|uniref:Response regulator n=1 Tax=Petrachloros mirabilis ULC683 TaxID=2781853 RepID=A0A8K2A9I8_9CYAN|nr:response regulator [Petrachloros mirabilis]NCJ08245.1 response regulator [Petrachloros mirabilis ULC683]